MLSTTHSLTSALIVSQIPSPIISFPLIIIGHYLLDAIPHWDTGTGLTSGTKTKKQAFFATLIDLMIAVISVFLLFQVGKKLSIKLWLGVVAGIAPDILEAPALFLNYRPFPINWLERLHIFFHRRWQFPYGLIPQIIIIAFILLITFLT
mgnify:CR=1 FL=1